VHGVARHVEVKPAVAAEPGLQAVEGGDRHHEPPAAAQRPPRDIDCRRRIVDVLEDVPEEDDIGALGLDHRILERDPPDGEALVGPGGEWIDARDDATAAPQYGEHSSIACAEIEDARAAAHCTDGGQRRAVTDTPKRLEQPIDSRRR